MMPDVARDATTFTSGGPAHGGRYTQPLSGLLISVLLALASIALISSFLGETLVCDRDGGSERGVS